MSETYISFGHLDPEVINDPWVLVLGGISRAGNRRARRAARAAVRTGYHVLWFDGFEEVDPHHPDRRLEVLEPTGPDQVTVLGYKIVERHQLLNRLAFGKLPETETGAIANGGDKKRWIGLMIFRLALRIRKRIIRKIYKAVRGYLNWRKLRPEILKLRSLPNPAFIVYCDEYATPSAWHATRIWDKVPADMEFKLK